MLPKLKILFLCTGNSCRSQMAEAWARRLKPERIEAYSAGTDPSEVNPLAAKVMAELGVDLSAQRAKHVRQLPGVEFDYVVTVCDRANRDCPVFPGKTCLVHVGFDDPPRLASHARNEEEALAHYRRVRDEIREWIETLPESLETKAMTNQE